MIFQRASYPIRRMTHKMQWLYLTHTRPPNRNKPAEVAQAKRTAENILLSSAETLSTWQWSASTSWALLEVLSRGGHRAASKKLTPQKREQLEQTLRLSSFMAERERRKYAAKRKLFKLLRLCPPGSRNPKKFLAQHGRAKRREGSPTIVIRPPRGSHQYRSPALGE